MENKTETVFKNAEGQEVCTCIDCKKEFTPFEWTDDCYSCNGEGEREMEMEWEYTPSMRTCPFCRGKGFHTNVEKKRCKSCQEHYHYMCENEDD